MKITLFTTQGILLPWPNAHFFPSLTFISFGHNKIFREKRSFFQCITGDCILVLYRIIVILDSAGNFIFPREIFSSFPSPYGSAKILLDQTRIYIFCVKASLTSSLLLHIFSAVTQLFGCIPFLLYLCLPESLRFPTQFFLNCVKNTLLSCFSAPVFFRENFSQFIEWYYPLSLLNLTYHRLYPPFFSVKTSLFSQPISQLLLDFLRAFS